MLLYLSLIDNEENKSKFEEIYNAYKKTMFYVANGILNDEFQAEDAVHISFLKIMKNIDKIDEPICNKTKGFIVIIVKNTAIDIYRKNKREREKIEILENEYIISTKEISSNNDNLSNKIESAILKLPEIYKEVFFLKYCHNLHDDEISKMLSIKPSTIRTRILRGKKKLKSILEEMQVHSIG